MDFRQKSSGKVPLALHVLDQASARVDRSSATEGKENGSSCKMLLPLIHLYKPTHTYANLHKAAEGHVQGQLLPITATDLQQWSIGHWEEGLPWDLG